MLYIESYLSNSDYSGFYQSPMHSHEFYEIYCLLSGEVEYCVEGHRYFLGVGDVVLMRSGEVHHYELNGSGTYRRIGVYFTLPLLDDLFPHAQLLTPFLERSAGYFNHYPAQYFRNNNWTHYIQKIHSANSSQEAFCYLLPLLMDLAECFPALKESPPAVKKDSALPVIQYINQNIYTDLSLSSLATRFYISKPQLNRIFRSATGTTVWDYIIVKRLFLAKEMLEAGERPSAVFSKCGFRDYTTFYRAYKRHFGISPRQQK